MACLSAEELAALFDGRLGSGRAAQGRTHLAGCPRCAAEIQRLSMSLRDAEGNAAPPPSMGLLDQAVRLGLQPARPGAAEVPAFLEPADARPTSPEERK